MVNRRSTRVTQVSPWIPGGDGQLRDLFPLPPWLFLVGRGLLLALRHFVTTIVSIISCYLWIGQDWTPLAAFIIFPLTFLLLRTLLLTAYLWYRNPTIPLFARKQT